MKIIISPAKTINETSPLPTARHSLAIFPDEIAEVHKALKPLSPQKPHALRSLPMMVMYMRDWMLIRFLKCKLTSYKGVCGFSLGSMVC